MNEKVAILDAGAQYCKVIDRRIRELKVDCEILPLQTPAADLSQAGYSAIVISGGPQSVYSDQRLGFDPMILEMGIPVLGICYGMQLLNHVCGGVVEKLDERSDGVFKISIDRNDPLYATIDSDTINVLLTHGDHAKELSDQFIATGHSDEYIVSMSHKELPIFAVQYHPEVDLTDEGMTIMRNFLIGVCNFSGSFTLGNRLELALEYIRETVGDSSVLVLVSGGVDSAVCASLLARAIPTEKIFALHIDNGFMRMNESDTVNHLLVDVGLAITVRRAAEDFYSAFTEIDGIQYGPLRDIIDPETKRKIIGDCFINVSQEEIDKLGLTIDDVYLAQGTLRPDLIESASNAVSSNADTIKTHHNDSALVRALRDRGRVVEPLKDYHKDEVRALGMMLGLDESLVWRQPFPGPGLSIRTMCALEPFKIDNAVKLQSILDEVVEFPFTANILPVRSVGVQGDGRSYSSVVGLTGEMDWNELFRLALKIPKQAHNVNRVVYVFPPLDDLKNDSEDFSSITVTRLHPEELHQLQEADDIVNRILYKHKLIRTLSQVPVILTPANFGRDGERSIVLRPFVTNDFMTGRAAVPGVHIPEDVVLELVHEVLTKVDGICRVMYDLTNKPPGTTEWE